MLTPTGAWVCVMSQRRVRALPVSFASRAGPNSAFSTSSFNVSPSRGSRQVANPDPVAHGASKEEDPISPVGASMGGIVNGCGNGKGGRLPSW